MDDVLSISAVQQSDPVIHTYICVCVYIYIYSFPHIILYHVPSQVTTYSSLCYTAGSHGQVYFQLKCLSRPLFSYELMVGDWLSARQPWSPLVETVNSLVLF